MNITTKSPQTKKVSANKNFPIDAVYMWVNGNDPQWIKKRNALQEDFTQKGIQILPSAVSPSRFLDNDELRYSLRSLEMFAPWIRNVYIVTDNQYPKWVDRSTVHIISHQEIFPSHASYPVFSNRPIEFCLHRIPDIAEHYLYFNDDFMLGKSVQKNDFFTPQGAPVIWVSRLSKRRRLLLQNNPSPTASPHQISTLRAHRLINQHYKKNIPYRIEHYPRAMTKSSVEMLCALFPKEIKMTLTSPFRSKQDLSIFPLYSLFAIACGLGRRKLINHEGLLRDLLNLRISHIGASLGDGNVTSKLRKIKRLKPLTFCINDAEHAQNKDRSHLQSFLKEYFPKPSRFEL